MLDIFTDRAIMVIHSLRQGTQKMSNLSEQAAEQLYDQLWDEGESAGFSDDAIQGWIERIWENRYAEIPDGGEMYA